MWVGKTVPIRGTYVKWLGVVFTFGASETVEVVGVQRFFCFLCEGTAICKRRLRGLQSAVEVGHAKNVTKEKQQKRGCAEQQTAIAGANGKMADCCEGR